VNGKVDDAVKSPVHARIGHFKPIQHDEIDGAVLHLVDDGQVVLFCG
jgi:hypothetical protein